MNPRGFGPRAIGAMLLLASVLFTGLASAVAAPLAATEVVNTASVNYQDANGNSRPSPTVSNQVSTALNPEPVLEITITASSNPVGMGAPLSFDIEFTNSGTKAALNTVVEVQLSEHVILNGSSGPSLSPGAAVGAPGDGALLSWNIGALQPGASGTLTVDTTVKTPADYLLGETPIADGTVIDTEASVVSDNTVTAISTSSAVLVGLAPNLTLLKSVSDPTLQLSETATYGLTYANTGNQDATNVTITDTIPSGMVYVPGSASAGGVLSGGVLTWVFPTVAQGETRSVTFDATVDPGTPLGATISNQGFIVSDLMASTPSNLVTSTVVAPPSATLTVTPEASVVPVGGLIVMTAEATNTGTTTIPFLTLDNPLPAGTTFVSADTGGSFVISPAGGVINWNLGPLDPAQSITVSFTLRIDNSLAAGSAIDNYTTLGGAISDTVTVLTTIVTSARTDATVAYTDPAGTPVTIYGIGGSVCVSVNDPDLNGLQLVAETTSVVISSSLPPDQETLTLTETGIDTGNFNGCIASTPVATATPEDGAISALAGAVLTATHTDPTDATPDVAAVIRVAPTGVVFDASTGNPVNNAQVTLFDGFDRKVSLPNGYANPVTTGFDGYFTFPALPAGDYRLGVSTSGKYAFPSITPDSALPPSFTVTDASRGLPFTLAAPSALALDIPLDPAITVDIFVKKSVNRSAASVGDLIRYSVEVENLSGAAVDGVTLIDTFPAGVHYKAGTSRINGAAASDPVADGTRSLTWQLGAMAADDVLTIDYISVIGAGARTGEAINRALAVGTLGGTATESNLASATMTIRRGIFTDRGTIIGKVFIDGNCNLLQDAEEKGVANVTLYMEDGTRVVTDQNGLYSIPKVKSGTHVLLLDKSTLPAGLCTTPTSGKFMGSSDSQFVDLGYGSLVKANFGVFDCGAPEVSTTIIGGLEPQEHAAPETTTLFEEMARDDSAEDNEAQQAAGQSADPSAQASAATADNGVPTEEAIEALDADFTILSPADGAVITKEFVTITVQAHKNTPVVLEVNGDKVPDTRISRTMTSQNSNVVVYEYLNVPLRRGGMNKVAAIEMRPTGAVGALEEITVNTIGTPDTIDVTFSDEEVLADGRSTTQVTMTVKDSAGRVLAADGHITVYTTAGKIKGDDADIATPDHQVLLTGGVASFTIEAPHETQTATVVGSYGNVEGSEELFFAPHLREMLIVGYGEVALTPKGSSGEFESGGRGAFFAKGTVGDGVLLTAAYDSDGGDEGLFSPEAEDAEAEDDYPTYGDESQTGYEANSSDKLYVRLDKGRSHALWGDYNTKLTENQLTAYRRALTGAEVEGEFGPLEAYGFYSYTSRTQSVESYRGKGISGYYYLAKSPVVVGTERITIETRDRGRTDRVLKRTTVFRGVDYRIDYDLGIVMFLRPVPSMDEGFNPVYVVVSYERDAPGDEYSLGGARVGWNVTDWLNVGVTGIYEEQQLDDYELLGADATVNLPGDTTIKGEVASSKANITDAYLPDPKSGVAHAVELESNPTSDLSLGAYYRNVDDKFVNDSATSVSRGSITYGGQAQFIADDATRLNLQFFVEDDNLNEMENRGISAGVERKFGKTTGTLTLAHNESRDKYVPPSDPDSREPYDISRETVDEATTIEVGVATRVTDDLQLSASHKQDVTDGTNNLTGAGVDYALNELNRLYLRGEYETQQDFETARLVTGIESKVTDNTVAFNESRMTNGQSGLRNVQVAGLRNRLLLDTGLSADFSLEQHHTTSGVEDGSEPDAFAATSAVEYVPDEKNRLSARAEYLKVTSRSGRYSFLSELGAAHKFDDLSLMATAKYFNDETAVDSSFTQLRLRVGLAKRPVATDRFHGLAMVEYRIDDRSGVDYGYDTTTYLASLAGNYQLDDRTQLNAKWAGKVAKDLGTSAYTDLYSLGFIHDIADRWDVGAKYRLLRSETVDTIEHGGQVELGYRVDKNIWLTGGYSYDDFDQDLTGESFTNRGPFIKLRVKWPVRDIKLLGEVPESSRTCTEPTPISVVVQNPPVKFEAPISIVGDNPPVKMEGPITVVAENPPLTVPEPVDVTPVEPIVEYGEEPQMESKVLLKLPQAVAPAVIPAQFADMVPVEPTEQPAMVIELFVHFEKNSAVVKDKYLKEIAAAAEMMKQYPDTWIVVEGHSDNRGSFPYNMKLSKYRAKSVAVLLTDKYGIKGSRIQEAGYGYTKNIATNDTKEGRAKNRRVYVVFYDKKP